MIVNSILSDTVRKLHSTKLDYADDLVLLANTPAQAKSTLHSLKQAARSIGLYMGSDIIYFMCFNQNDGMFSLNVKPLKVHIS